MLFANNLMVLILMVYKTGMGNDVLILRGVGIRVEYHKVIFVFLRAIQAPNLDVDKLFEEIMLDVPNHSDSRPLAVHSPQKKEDSNLR